MLDIYVSNKLKKIQEDIVEMVVVVVKYVGCYINDIEFFCEDVGCIYIDYLCCMVEVVINVGVIMVNILDIVGYIMLIEFGGIIKQLFNCVFNIDKVIIFVYCYNDLGLVVVNFLVVVENGVCQVECIINGIGECVGNCLLEEIVMILQICQVMYDLNININLKEISCMFKLVSQLCNMLVQLNKVIVGSNVFSYLLGIYQDGVLKV